MCEYVFQESVHSTWLNNGLAEFQSRLTDALTGTSAGANAADAHSPLTRATAAAGAAATSGGGGSSKQARPPPVI